MKARMAEVRWTAVDDDDDDDDDEDDEEFCCSALRLMVATVLA